MVDSLGHIGLLYLMFLAGLELDLNVFARLRQAAIQFGLLTFALPMAFGFVGARWLGFDLPASILIGSLWASHTLVMYPIMQRFGITADPAVATTVGATVITDTLALLVLAVVASGATGEGGLASNLALLVGLGVLALYCAFVLTFLTRWFFGGLGQDRTLRFVFVLAAFLSASFVAELGGIEGIVGAFFAGLALNRLVPNGGPLMDRVEFFGGALFIPAFLVSVGLLIDPTVLADPRTWQLAIVFAISLVLGKGGAALAIGRIRRFSRAAGGGHLRPVAVAGGGDAGRDDGRRVGRAVRRRRRQRRGGRHRVQPVHVVGAGDARRGPDRAPGPRRTSVGVGDHCRDRGRRHGPPARAGPRPDRPARRRDRRAGARDRRRRGPPAGRGARTAREIDEAVRRAGIEADPSLRVAQSVRQGVRNEIHEHDGSLLVIARHGAIRAKDYLFGGLSEEIVAASPVPVMVVEMDEAPVRRVLLPLRAHDLRASRRAETGLAVEVARRLAASGLELVVGRPDGAVCRTRCRSPRRRGSSRWRPTAIAGSGRRRRPATSCCSPGPARRSCSDRTPRASPRCPTSRSRSSSRRSPRRASRSRRRWARSSRATPRRSDAGQAHRARP